MRTKKVVFFFPAFSSQEATAPLGILAVSTPLLRAGYQVRIIDSTITPNFQKRVHGRTGRRAVPGRFAGHRTDDPGNRANRARSAKQLYPDMPVVLGGWHPSLLPDQTLAADYVDVVVKGQGEEALLEVVQRIEAGESHGGHRRASDTKKTAGSFSIRRARLKPIREMPPKAYHLADFDAYERVCGRRWAMYTSSLACPYNCAYCTNDGVYGRKWNALDPDQVVEETTDLVSRYGPAAAVGCRRQLSGGSRARCRHRRRIGAPGVHFDWSIQAFTNLVTSASPWRS